MQPAEVLADDDCASALDDLWRPVDCYTRLQKNGAYLGDGWFRFGKDFAALESYNVGLGRVSQRMDLDQW